MSELGDTATRLVTAAERLFVEGGEAATSLRAIARAAHANAAAVHYHFGGRDQLLRAVLQRQVEPLTVRRRQALDDLPVRPTPAHVVEALVRPDLELLGRLRRDKVEVARFLGRAGDLGDPAADRRAGSMLRDALPDVDEAEIATRLRLVAAVVASLFANVPAPGEPGPLGTDDVDEQVRRLVAFCAAGLSAPAGAAKAPRAEKPRAEKPRAEKPRAEKPVADKPVGEKARSAAKGPMAEKALKPRGDRKKKRSP